MPDERDDSVRVGLARLRDPLRPSESPGLDSVDPRLMLLNTLCEKGQLEDLVSEVDQMLDAAVYDIRPISMYLWAAFWELGLGVLPELFETLTVLVSLNLPAIGPVQKKLEHVSKRTSWLMQKISDALEYHESRATPEWSRWTAGIGVEGIEATLERAGTFDASLDERFAPMRPALQKFMARLRLLSATLLRIPSLPPVSIASPVMTSIAPPQHNRLPDDLQVAARLGRAEVGVSHEFFALIQKLDAFSKLVKKSDMARAAVVADDLMRTIETFDPRMYFPELFSDFSELLSKHIDTLEGHWHDRDSTAWKAHAQFYRVDLRRFVSGQ